MGAFPHRLIQHSSYPVVHDCTLSTIDCKAASCFIPKLYSTHASLQKGSFIALCALKCAHKQEEPFAGQSTCLL